MLELSRRYTVYCAIIEALYEKLTLDHMFIAPVSQVVHGSHAQLSTPTEATDTYLPGVNAVFVGILMDVLNSLHEIEIIVGEFGLRPLPVINREYNAVPVNSVPFTLVKELLSSSYNNGASMAVN